MLKARRSDRPPAAKETIKKTNNTIKNPYNFKFGFIKKYIIYIFIALFILFFAFTLLAPTFINLKVWKPEIISMLEKISGKSANIKGDIKLSIYPSPQIKIYDISLQETQDGISSNFIYSNSVVAKLSLWPLFKGNIVIDKVILENIEINLKNLPEQSPNWIFTTKENLLEVNNDQINEKYSKFNQIKYPNIKLSKINEYTIRSGNITYNNNYKIGLKNIIISSNNDVDLIKGNLDINGKNFDLNSSFIKTKDIDNLWKTSLSIINQDIKINTSGNMQFDGTYPSLEGKIELISKNLEGLSKDWNNKYLTILDNKSKIIGDISFNFKENNLFYSIYNLSINSGPFIFTGALSGNNGISPEIKIILSSNNIDMDLLQRKLSKLNYFKSEKDKEEITDKKSYWNFYKGSLLLSVGTAKFLEYPIRDMVIDLKKESKGYILNSAKATFPGNTKIGFEGKFKNDFTIFEGYSTFNSDNIRDFCKWVSIDLNNISDSRLRQTKINSNVVFRKGGATFAGISGIIDSSNISGEVILRFQELNNFTANLKIDNLNVDAYLEKNTEEKSSDNNKDFEIFNFDSLNINLDISQALLLKNQYNNIKINSVYKNNTLQISDLKILDFAKGNLKLYGNIDFNNKKEIYDLSVDINHKDFSELLNFYKLPKYFYKIFKGAGNVSIITKGAKESLFSNINIETPSTIMSYEGSMVIKSLTLLNYEGQLKLKFNNLYEIFNTRSSENAEKAQYSSLISFDKNILNLENIIFESPNYKYSGDVDIEYLDNNKIELNTNISSNYITLDGITDFYSFFNMSSKIPIKGNMKINSKLFYINNYKISDFNSSLNFTDKEMIFKNFEGKFLNGNISLDGKRSNYEDKIFIGNIKLSKINGSKLINNYFFYDKIDGEVSSKLKITGKSNNLDEFFNTLNAEGEVTFKNILIKGLDINKFATVYNIKNKLDFDKYIFESFNTDKEILLDNLSSQYSIKDNKVIFEGIDINVGEYNSLLDGEFNLKNKNYNSSIKFIYNNSDNNYLSINFARVDNNQNNYIETDFIQENLNNLDIIPDTNNKVDIINIQGSKDEEDFDDVLNDLSKNSIIEKLENEKVLNQKSTDNDDQLIQSNLKDDNEIIKPTILKPILPDYLKDMKNSSYFEFTYPIPPKNNIIKPKLQSQDEIEEGILNDLLDSVLSPDN